MTSDRVVLLFILTACMFGLSIYMQDGTWIFPFPLYEIGMLAGIAAIYIADKKTLKLPGFLALSWGVLHLLTAQFFWEFFNSDQYMEVFYGGMATDYLMIAFCTVFLSWGICISLQTEKIAFRVAGIILAIAAVTCLLVNSYFGAMIPLVAWLILLFLQKPVLHRNILALFVFFHLTEYFTLLFMGSTDG